MGGVGDQAELYGGQGDEEEDREEAEVLDGGLAAVVRPPPLPGARRPLRRGEGAGGSGRCDRVAGEDVRCFGEYGIFSGECGIFCAEYGTFCAECCTFCAEYGIFSGEYGISVLLLLDRARVALHVEREADRARKRTGTRSVTSAVTKPPAVPQSTVASPSHAPGSFSRPASRQAPCRWPGLAAVPARTASSAALPARVNVYPTSTSCHSTARVNRIAGVMPRNSTVT